ncbi:DUF895 domain membrane protein [Rhizophlyctis rosea]|nr:DUF895 domain membrane protein [Rhizophlyctis rosea]
MASPKESYLKRRSLTNLSFDPTPGPPGAGSDILKTTRTEATERAGLLASSAGGAPSGSDAATVKSYTQKTAYLGTAFCLLFTAFNVAQAFLTTIYPSIGLLVLGILYGCFALGSIIGPQVGERVGLRWAMCGGAACFVLFIFTLNLKIEGLVLLVAAINGFGSGVLWINQGVWVSRVGKLTGGTMSGFFTGLFFTICNLNGVVGNSLAILIFLIGLGTDAMLWAMFFIGLSGCTMMAFADPLTEAPSQGLKAKPPPAGGLGDAILAMWEVTTMKNSLVLLPTILLQGCNLAFVFGSYPQFVRGGSIEVAAVFLCFGLASCSFSFINGKIYDKYGQPPLLYAYLSTGLLIYTLVPTVAANPSTPPTALTFTLCLGGFIYGTFDAFLNTLINLALSRAYRPGAQTSAAFGFYRVGFCVAMSVTSVGASVVPWGLIVVVNFGLILCGFGALYFKRGLLEPEMVQPLVEADFAGDEDGTDFGIDSEDEGMGGKKVGEV